MAAKKHKLQDLDIIKAQLLEERERLQKELSGFSEKNPHVEGDYNAKFEDVGDEVDDSVQEVAQYQVSKSLEITLEKRLRDINKSLDRIEKGDYGICKYCDEPISIPRLQARPTSSSCVSCKKTLKDEV